MNTIPTALPSELFDQLQKEKLVLLGTIDADTGEPRSNAISWMYAVDEVTLRLALDRRSRLIASIAANPQVVVTVFAASSIYAISGKAILTAETLDDVPIKLACFDIAVASVRDAMFYGARIAVQPEYEKTYDRRAAAKLDGQVYAAMKKA